MLLAMHKLEHKALPRQIVPLTACWRISRQAGPPGIGPRAGVTAKLGTHQGRRHKNRLTHSTYKGSGSGQRSSRASGIAWQFFFHDQRRLADVKPSRRWS